MNKLLVCLFAALVASEPVCAKPKTPATHGHKADAEGRKAGPKANKNGQNAGQKQKQNGAKTVGQKLDVTLDGFFIEGRKLNYSFKERTEMYGSDLDTEGWKCHESNGLTVCERTVETTLHCTIEKVEETGKPQTKEYSRKSMIKCAHQGDAGEEVDHIVGGCWTSNSKGISFNPKCTDDQFADEIFKYPVKTGPKKIPQEDFCSTSDEIQKEKDELFCTIFSTDCGDGAYSRVCYSNIEGLVSIHSEFSGGIVGETDIRLLNPILPIPSSK